MIKSTIVRDGATITFEGESAQDIAVAVSGVLSGRSQQAKPVEAQSPKVTKIKLKRGRPRKDVAGERKYKRAPWSKEDVLSVTRILIDVGRPIKATPRAFDYLKSYGKIRNRSYQAVQLMVQDISKYLRFGKEFGKHNGKYLTEAGFNPKSLPQLGVEPATASLIPRKLEVRSETPQPVEA